VDASGNLYIGGAAGVTGTAAISAGEVVALNAAGSAISYTASLAGVPTALTVNPSGNLVAAGNGTGVAVGLNLQGIYVQTLDSSGSVQSSLFPGGNPSDSVSSIATDSAGRSSSPNHFIACLSHHQRYGLAQRADTPVEQRRRFRIYHSGRAQR